MVYAQLKYFFIIRRINNNLASNSKCQKLDHDNNV